MNCKLIKAPHSPSNMITISSVALLSLCYPDAEVVWDLLQKEITLHGDDNKKSIVASDEKSLLDATMTFINLPMSLQIQRFADCARNPNDHRPVTVNSTNTPNLHELSVFFKHMEPDVTVAVLKTLFKQLRPNQEWSINY